MSLVRIVDTARYRAVVVLWTARSYVRVLAEGVRAIGWWFVPTEKVATCCACGGHTWDDQARAQGWRYATIHTGDAAWMCGDCLGNDVDGDWWV